MTPEVFGKNAAMKEMLSGNHKPSLMRRFINSITSNRKEDLQQQLLRGSTQTYGNNSEHSSLATQTEGDGN